MFFSLNNNLNQNTNTNFGNINNNNHNLNGNNPFHNALPTPSPSASPSTPGPLPPLGGNNGNNGYRLLSAQGMETLQAFLREHGNDCIKQFVKKLEDKFQQQTASPTKLELEPAIQEMQARERRAQNIFIFGVEESNSPEPEQKSAFDLKKATSIIRDINGLTEPAKVKTTRIGRYEANKKIPIRATFPTKEEALQVLRLKSKLKEQSNTYIKYDLTPSQRTYLKTVISELETRKVVGEIDLIIKYQTNIPKIVKASTRAASKN
ncbi:unnamed protein product [Ceutorhynchus assimilis]|uniref:Uncharacterized protein n=1 Tax=Ceutorhynchus assimilis TaxID=467358 RepID=A0A9N9QG92_9CUCU|nr:unnamed protein product [Ceutorhynchus assimilis]